MNLNANVNVDGITSWQMLAVVVIAGFLIQCAYNLGYQNGWNALAAAWRHRQP